jgi:hypothetical protein
MSRLGSPALIIKALVLLVSVLGSSADKDRVVIGPEKKFGDLVGQLIVASGVGKRYPYEVGLFRGMGELPFLRAAFEQLKERLRNPEKAIEDFCFIGESFPSTYIWFKIHHAKESEDEEKLKQAVGGMFEQLVGPKGYPGEYVFNRLHPLTTLIKEKEMSPAGFLKHISSMVRERPFILLFFVHEKYIFIKLDSMIRYRTTEKDYSYFKGRVKRDLMSLGFDERDVERDLDEACEILDALVESVSEGYKKTAASSTQGK